MGGFLYSLFAPSNSLLLLLAVGLVLACCGLRKTGLGLAVISFVAFVAWGVSPAGHAMITALETRFPQPRQMPERIAGIIVLGGSVEPFQSLYWEQPALNDRAERLTAAVGLARQYPEAPVAFTGGLGGIREAEFTEADVAEMFFREQHVDNPLIFEANASNTHENATDLVNLLPRDRQGPWILVTSAYHMPRSVGVFRSAGIDVLPFPVDYKTVPEFSGWWYEIADSASFADFATREWIALYMYHRRGWIDDPFPAP